MPLSSFDFATAVATTFDAPRRRTFTVNGAGIDGATSSWFSKRSRASIHSRTGRPEPSFHVSSPSGQLGP